MIRARFGPALAMLLLAAPQAWAHPLCLWEIHTAAAKLFLLGSIHVVRADTYPLPGPIEAAFGESETVVVEVDMSRVPARQVAAAMKERGAYPPSGSILPHLRDSTRKALLAWLKAHDLGYDKVAHTRPWLLALQLQLSELRRLGYRPELGIDQHFIREAARTGKRVDQLETFGQQLEILSGDPPAIQELMLRATLDELPNTQREAARLVSAWRHGDIDELYRLAMQSARKYPALSARMAAQTAARNRRMAARINRLLAQGGNYLVIVGALHMGGEQGLVELLGKDFRLRQASD